MYDAPTQKQITLIFRLCKERGVRFEDALPDDATRAQASAQIDRLLAMPRERNDWDDVPTPDPGYYALGYLGVLRFYRVVEGSGKWDGRVFLNRFRSDDETRVGAAERVHAFRTICDDPEAARALFAAETVRCHRCGRLLTDDVSRERGMGPDCAAM